MLNKKQKINKTRWIEEFKRARKIMKKKNALFNRWSREIKQINYSN